jgi:hypothetical protein
VYCLQALHTTVICGALENYVLLLSICRASFKILELMDLAKEEEELMKHTCNNPPDSIWARAPFKPDSPVHPAHELLLIFFTFYRIIQIHSSIFLQGYTTRRQGNKFRINKTLLR